MKVEVTAGADRVVLVRAQADFGKRKAEVAAVVVVVPSALTKTAVIGEVASAVVEAEVAVAAVVRGHLITQVRERVVGARARGPVETTSVEMKRVMNGVDGRGVKRVREDRKAIAWLRTKNC